MLPFADWARANALHAASLDPSGPLDDLEFLDDVVGDARVVAIGESAHYVREYHLIRHRLLRYLVERRGFTVYAIDGPFTESHAIDRWVKGSDERTIEDIAANEIPLGVGRTREVRDYLTWIREHNRSADRALTFAGVDMPRTEGSPLAALAEVESFLEKADRDALPLVRTAKECATQYAASTTMTARRLYAALDASVQDALTAALSRLLSRMDSMRRFQVSQGIGDEHDVAVQHLRSAWYLDLYYRDCVGRGIQVGSACRDLLMAECVLRLLSNDAGTRIVFGSHNAHIRKTVVTPGDVVFGLFPVGYHLGHDLGADYVSIAATTIGGRTTRGDHVPSSPLGFVIGDHPVPTPAEGSIEGALPATAPLSFTDLRAAKRAIEDADSYQLIRKDDGFMEVPVFEGYDVIASVPETSCNDYVEFEQERVLAGQA